jgi:FKBP-type peptidyl-prolyl cis-trans isomerases 1
MRGLLLTIGLCAALAIAGCGGGGSSSSSTAESSTPASSEAAADVGKKKPKVEVPGGPPPKTLEKKELVEGSGAEAKAGDEVTVQYVGVGYTSKEQFDASWDRGEPFSFALGAGQVIAGWEEGIPGMKVGGRRELTIPGELAYGATGSPPTIGPNETLIFVVDLLAAK